MTPQQKSFSNSFLSISERTIRQYLQVQGAYTLIK